MIENLNDFLAQNSEIFESTRPEKSNTNELIEYRPRPADSKDDDGIYRSTIKIIRDLREQGPRSLFNLKRTYFFNQNGQSLAWDVAEKDDPALNVFYTLKRHPNKALSEGVINKLDENRMFRLTISDYVLIQIIEDKNNPDLKGRFMVWKLPKAIKDMIELRESRKIKPGYTEPIVGFALNLEVTPGPKDPSNPQREVREIKYTSSEFDTDMIQPMLKTDGTSFLTDEQYDVLNEFATTLNKVTKKGIESASQSVIANISQMLNDSKDLMNTVTKEMTEYMFSLGDECVSGVKFVEPKPHSNEDLIRFVEMVSTYMKRLGATQDEVFGVLQRCKLLEYSVEATYSNTAPAMSQPAAPQSQPQDDAVKAAANVVLDMPF